MFHKIPDSRIIEGIRQQDDETLNWLYDNYRETIRHHILRNSGSEADVSDIFQESIITLYNQISGNELKLTTDLKGYFFSIARNIWSATLRKKLRSIEIDTELPDDGGSDEAGSEILERIVSRAFRKLKPDCQTILTLFSEGCSFEEIALKMNLKNEAFARRKKYLSKETLLELIKEDPDYKDYLNL